MSFARHIGQSGKFSRLQPILCIISVIPDHNSAGAERPHKECKKQQLPRQCFLTTSGKKTGNSFIPKQTAVQAAASCEQQSGLKPN